MEWTVPAFIRLWSHLLGNYAASARIAVVLVAVAAAMAFGGLLLPWKLQHRPIYFRIKLNLNFFTFLPVILVVVGIVVLMFRPLPLSAAVSFFLSILVLLFSIGFRVGIVLQRHSIAVVYIAFLLLMVLAVLAANYIPAQIRSATMTKQQLKDSFRRITGKDPSKEDKKAFWGTTVGEEEPSQERKNQFWQNRD